MKKSLVLTVSMTFLVASLAACQKTPEEKVADALKEMTSDNQVERMDKIRKEGNESIEKLFGPKKSKPSQTGPVTATKATDSETK